MPQAQTARPSMAVRLIHVSFIIGIILFAAVDYAVVRPQRSGESIPPAAAHALQGLAVAAMALSVFVLRGRVPRRSTDESADLYWTRATGPALVAWAPLEGGALLGLVTYMLDGSAASLAVAALALLGLMILNPWQIERS